MTGEILTDKIGFTTLSMFAEDGLTYKNYQKKLREGKLDSTEYFDFGTAFHKYVLQPTLFEKEYIQMNQKFPEGKYAEAVKVLIATQDIYQEGETDRTEEWLQNAIVKADLEKCTPDSLHKKIWDNEKDKSYLNMFSFLEENKNKKVITLEDWNTLCFMKQSILNSAYAGEFLYVAYNPPEGIEIFTELNILWKHPKFSLRELDSTLDRIIINHNERIITIFDLKSTSKKLSKFNNILQEYNYPRQGCMYIQAVKYKFRELLEAGYKIIYNLIVVEKETELKRCFKFTMSNTTYIEECTKLDGLLVSLEEAYVYGNFNTINGEQDHIVF